MAVAVDGCGARWWRAAAAHVHHYHHDWGQHYHQVIANTAKANQANPVAEARQAVVSKVEHGETEQARGGLYTKA